MSVKTFKIAFPIYGTAYSVVRIEEEEIKNKTEEKIKEILLQKSTTPKVCHYCSETIEELNPDQDHFGDHLENIEFWETIKN